MNYFGVSVNTVFIQKQQGGEEGSLVCHDQMAGDLAPLVEYSTSMNETLCLLPGTT